MAYFPKESADGGIHRLNQLNEGWTYEHRSLRTSNFILGTTANFNQSRSATEKEEEKLVQYRYCFEEGNEIKGRQLD